MITIHLIYRVSRLIPNPLIRPYSKTTTHNLNEILRNMPKEKKHIAEAQKQRTKIKEKNSKYSPGKVALQVLGTGAAGAPRCLYLFSDQSRYLFNCGEGTQRLAHEHKMKLAKLEHIFVTQPVWKNIGGLPGTALTIQDVGVPEITLHGPEGLNELFVATRRFVILKDLRVKMAHCDENTTFEDCVLKVQYVPLLRSRLEEESNSQRGNDSLTSLESNGGCENVKGIQIGCSTSETSEASTSTRSERKRHRSRSKSKSPSPRKTDLPGPGPGPEPEEDDIDYYAHERKNRRRSRSRSRSKSRSLNTDSGLRNKPSAVSARSRSVLEQNKEQGVSMAYVCRLQPRPGALSLDKCVKQGVPPGPLLGRLKNGEDVTLPNGSVVRSSDVCEPDDPGPVFIVVDCPSEDYLDSLVGNLVFKRHQAFAENEEDFCCLVVHFSPQSVIDSPRYKQWIDEFPVSTQHLLLNDSNTCMGSSSVHRIQYKLNLLSDDLFPLLGDIGTRIVDEEDSLNEDTAPASKKLKSDLTQSLSIEKLRFTPSPDDRVSIHPFIRPSTIFTYHLRPKKGVDRSQELTLSPRQYVREAMNERNMPAILDELRETMKAARLRLSKRPYPRLLFLGTGSCIPNKTRNTSGILLTMSEHRHVLLDCGEGTLGQLVRFFGRSRSEAILADLEAIYVSHLHADHHIGLVGLLLGRRAAVEALGRERRPVYLLAPKQIEYWLSFYDRCFEEIGADYELIGNGELINGSHTLSSSKKEELFKALEMVDINTCIVKHCPNAFGVCFRHKDGHKITYSGDTMPTETLVDLGEDSDVLIHEATMEDELAHEAVVKMHSTTSQAIEVGNRMGARNILLTHFSQRYAKLPRFNKNLTENVGIAFDNMQIRLDDLPLVPLLYPALKTMFAEHYEELEMKAVKRQLKYEREREASVEARKEKV